MSSTRRTKKLFASARTNADQKVKASLSQFRFVMSLAPRVHDVTNLKGQLLVACPDGIQLRMNGATVADNEIAVPVEYDLTARDILASLPMPPECEPLAFAQFVAAEHASRGALISPQQRAAVESELHGFLRKASRGRKSY